MAALEASGTAETGGVGVTGTLPPPVGSVPVPPSPSPGFWSLVPDCVGAGAGLAGDGAGGVGAGGAGGVDDDG